MYLQMLAAPEILKGNHVLCGAETGVLTFSVCHMCKGAYKLWGDLRPCGQSLDRKILLQHCIDEALASFIAKILLYP